MKRAGHICSFPVCNRITCGPGLRQGETANIGKASHIYSAADGGPRGTGGLSFAQRQAIENGIWLCGIHADLIDKNDGRDFPADLLKQYKRLHEERIRRERDGIGTRTGWIHSLRCVSGPIFRTPAELTLGKINIIHGGNGSGKSAICDWLEGLSNEAAFLNWATGKPDTQLGIEFLYLDPLPRRMRVRTISNREIEYFLDGEPVPFPPSPFRIIRIKDEERLLHRKLPDLDFISEVLTIAPSVVRNILKLVGGQFGSTIPRLRITNDKDDREFLWAHVEGTCSGLDLQRQLSHSERLRILVEIAAIAARYSARYVPTILIFNGNRLDNDWLGKLFEFLSDNSCHFQTIIESIDPRKELGEIVSRVRLEGRETDVLMACSLSN